MVDLKCNENVFEIWNRIGRKTPFKVRRWTWHPDTYFLVTRVEIKWDYYRRTGKLYGKAYGHFYLRGKQADNIYRGKRLPTGEIELACAGCYQWCLID